jgi:hypothetical protein
MIEALPDGRLHARVSEPLGPLGFGQLRDATLARTCSACRYVNGGSAIGSAVGRMPASMIASCRRQAVGATSLDAFMQLAYAGPQLQDGWVGLKDWTNCVIACTSRQFTR